MPRGPLIPVKTRREWLDKIEGGQATFSGLAKEEGRRPEVIKEGVARARRERQAEQANIAMLGERLEAHQRALLAALAGWEIRLQVERPEHLALFKTFRSAPRAGLDVPWVEVRDGRLRHTLGRRSDDDVAIQGYLEEHLRSSGQPWSPVNDWLKAYDAYVQECGALGDLALAVAHGLTGLDPVPEATNQEGMHQGFVVWACKLAVEGVDAVIADRTWDQVVIVEDQIRFGGTAIATVRQGGARRRRRVAVAFRQVTERVRNGEHAQTISNALPELSSALRARQRFFERVRVGQLVPGSCGVCEVLGR
jgi:hypothetical protein